MIKYNKNLLNILGLDESQFKVYEAALILGESGMQDLARRSGVKRTSIYTFIDELKEKGFIVETKRNKRKVYSAVDPLNVLEAQKNKMLEFEKIIPQLKAIHNISNIKPKVTYYEGVEGIETVYADMLKDKREILAFEDLEQMKKVLPKSFYDYFPSERAKKGIAFKSISRDSEITRDFVKSNIRLLRESKLIKSEELKTEINIYGNKVAVMSFKEHLPFCVLVEDENIAQTLRVLWSELWVRLGAKIG